MEQSKQTPKKKAYDAEYRRENMKRIPLEMKKKQYDALKAAADAVGKPVNRYIKDAITEAMERDNGGAVSPNTAQKPVESPVSDVSTPGGTETPGTVENASEGE